MIAALMTSSPLPPSATDAFPTVTGCAPGRAALISVVVPVRNEAGHIQRTLTQILTQQYDSHCYEVIVVDGQSTDGTWDIVAALQEKHSNLRLLSNPKRWSSSARNLAIRTAQGEILVIIDGHCEVDDPAYLWQLAYAFERSSADCIGRPQPLDVSNATVFQRAVAMARSSRLGHHPDSWIYSDVEQYVPPESVAVAYRREVFDRIGLFDESFDACEDVELNHRVARAGMTCFFTPRLQVRYVPRNNLSGLFRQMVRYGRGRYRLLRKHQDTFSIPCLLPAVFLSTVAILPSFAWVSPWLLTSYLAGLGVYMLTVLGFSLVLAFRAVRNLRSLGEFGRLVGWLPLVFATVHAGAGAGILQELAAETLSKIKKAFGYPQATAETARVLAWRASTEDLHAPTVPSQDFPRS
jgi:succinoglycan biosynthesis protein ExoA